MLSACCCSNQLMSMTRTRWLPWIKLVCHQQAVMLHAHGSGLESHYMAPGLIDLHATPKVNSRRHTSTSSSHLHPASLHEL